MQMGDIHQLLRKYFHTSGLDHSLVVHSEQCDERVKVCVFVDKVGISHFVLILLEQDREYEMIHLQMAVAGL